MYLINAKIARKEGSKPSNEQYLVDALSLTDVEAKLANEFKDIFTFIATCKNIEFTDIFESGAGTYFIIRLISDDMDGKANKEVFLQEADDSDVAKLLFREKVNYGVITDINLTNYMGIIR